MQSKEDLFQAAFDGHDEKVEQLLVHNPGLLNLHEERRFKSAGNGMYFPQGQATASIYVSFIVLHFFVYVLTFCLKWVLFMAEVLLYMLKRT